jgi:two-component system, LytTR family, response regulator
MPRIINCIIVDDEPVAREILESHLGKIDTVQVVASCRSAVEAFRVINSEPVDLIFLDINMPEISGLSFAKTMTKKIKIIFTTAYREYAVDGFDLQAVDYLLKPISFERLLQAINKFLDEIKPANLPEDLEVKSEKNDSFFVRSDRKMIKIDIAEIRYIESLSDYIKIHFGDKTVVTRETLSNIESKLQGNDFLRIHRSYIVSVTRIESFTHEYVMVNKHELPISRSHKEDVLQRLS